MGGRLTEKQTWKAKIKQILGHPATIWLFFVLGFVIRISYAIRLYPEFLPGDAQWYYQEARQLLQGKGMEFYWPPGLIFFLLPHLSWWGINPLGVVPAMLFAWLLLALAWDLTAKRYVANHWRGLGHLALVIWPTFVHQSIIPLAHLLIAWLLLRLFRSLDKDLRWWHGIGVGILLLGMALTRPATLILLPVLLWVWRNVQPLGHRWGAILALCLIVGGGLSAWVNYAHQETGRWIRINDANAYNFYLGNNTWTPTYQTWWLGSHDERGNPAFAAYYAELDSVDTLPPTEQQLAFQTLAWQHIRNKPGQFIIRIANRARTILAFDTLAGGTLWRKDHRLGTIFLIGDASLYVCLGICLIYAAFTRKSVLPPPAYQAMWLLMGAYLFPYLLAFSHPTYHLPILPLALLQTFGLLQGTKRNPTKAQRNWMWVSIGVFCLIQVEWVWYMAERLTHV